MKRQSLIILLLSLPLLMGVTLTPDSSSTASRPQTLIANHPDTSMETVSTPISELQFQTLGSTYPPCPGDPSNPNFPRTPSCPDINGAYPTGTTFNPNAIFSAASTYSAKSGSSPSYTYAQVNCPDICITTRKSTPDNPATIVTEPILVTSFQKESCPAGYIQKAEFNLQPAIVYIDVEQKLYGPFSSMDEFNSYNNNPAFKCDVRYVDYNGPGSYTMVLNFPAVDQGIIPNTNGKHKIDLTAASLADNYKNPYYMCSTNTAPPMKMAFGGTGVQTLKNYMLGTYTGPDNKPFDENLMVNANVGQWIAQWEWEKFNYNPTLSTVPTDYGNYSFAQSDTTCLGNWTSSSQANHRDIFFYYYRWQRCIPAGPKAWYFVSKYEPTSLICSRVKPVWTPAN